MFIYNLSNILEPFLILFIILIGIGIASCGICLAIAIYPPMTKTMYLFVDSKKVKTQKSLNKNIELAEEERELKNWVNNSYARLLLKRDYNYYKNEVEKTTNLFRTAFLILCILPIVLIGFGFLINQALLMTLIALILLLVFILGFVYASPLAEYTVKNSLTNEVAKLTYSQLLEIPMIVANTIAIIPASKRLNIISFLNQYLENAGSLASDIKLYLNQGSGASSIDKWKLRVLQYSNSATDISDYIRYIEVLQVMFLEGYTNNLENTLTSISTNIEDKIIKEQINSSLESNERLLQWVSTTMIILAISLILTPYIMQFISEMQGLMS